MGFTRDRRATHLLRWTKFTGVPVTACRVEKEMPDHVARQLQVSDKVEAVDCARCRHQADADAARRLVPDAEGCQPA